MTTAVDYAEAEEAAIQTAVDARIETLDESFLVTLAGFVRCAEQAGETKMHGAHIENTLAQSFRA